jgi:hypothetical protein
MVKNSAVNLDITLNTTGYTIGGGSTTERRLTISGISDFTLTQPGAIATTYTLASSIAADYLIPTSTYNAAGTILYGNATTGAGTSLPSVLAAGTSGQVLTSTGSALSWASYASIQWTGIAAAQTAVAGNGYYVTTGTQAVTLPATAAAGSYIAIAAAKGSTGWSIIQATGQSIQFGSTSTTTGSGGSLASNAVGDIVVLLCTTANNTWMVVSSVGNITIV